MKMVEQDRRIGKTREAIKDAMFSMLQEKQYSKITIQDIIDRANVGRSTFYSHFETKEDLLFCCIENQLEMLNQYIVDYIEREGNSPKLLSVVELFEHIKENNKIMKGLMKADSSDIFFEKVQAYWNSKIEENLKSKMSEDTVPRIPLVILANHISSTLIHLLKWWMNNKMPYTSAQMDQYFQELVNPVIRIMMLQSNK